MKGKRWLSAALGLAMMMSSMLAPLDAWAENETFAGETIAGAVIAGDTITGTTTGDTTTGTTTGDTTTGGTTAGDKTGDTTTGGTTAGDTTGDTTTGDTTTGDPSSGEILPDETFTEKKIVVLDPGHGGREAGSYAVHNGHVYKEEDINWKISCYTMQELQKYPDIEVHLTRTKNETKGLVSRVLTAKSYGADLLVSQHINDGGSPYPRGASVLISSGTYRPYLAEKEKIFGKYVISELGKLGITKRYASTGGMEYRMSEDGSRYPNGARRDYYAIVAQSVEQNIPGVIIEHAFVTNASDAANYLRTNKQLKKLGQADARAIIRYFRNISTETPKKDTVTPNKKNGWKTVGKSTYYYINGKKQTSRLLYLDDGIYYVDNKGRKRSGWRTINGSRYYFDKKEDCKAHIGWMMLDGDVYCFNKNGVMYQNTQLRTSSGKICILGEDGKRASGWCTYHGSRYYIAQTGYAHTGWLYNKRKWYYFNTKTGVMYKSCTVKISGVGKFKFNSKGVCTNRTDVDE